MQLTSGKSGHSLNDPIMLRRMTWKLESNENPYWNSLASTTKGDNQM